MGQRIHALAQHLFGKTTVEECDLKEVQMLANKFPYFAPAQILLLQKLKSENEEAYHSQLQKAILYYPNPLEFQLLVDEERFVVEESFELQTASFRKTESKEEVEEYNVVEQSTEWQNEKLEIATRGNIDVYNAPEQNHEQQPANFEKENKDDVDDSNVVEQSTEWQNEKLETAEDEEVGGYSEPGQNHEQQTANPETENNDDVEDSNVAEQATELQNEKLETGSEEHNYQSQFDIRTNTDFSNSESTSVNSQTTNAQQLSQNLELKTSNTADETPNPKLQTPNTTEPLAFEPYHTVDYFASQGIKIPANEMPKDKFGKQLKSFTEWLKTMKRLPATQATATIDAASENKVERLAAHSVDEANVVTEAMAEVWLKQGNPQKAIEVYHKLSLLYPAKRAFFAAKIENLKHL